MAERATDGTEPPRPVAAAMAACRRVHRADQPSRSATRARASRHRAGARGATMPGVTEEMLARVMSGRHGRDGGAVQGRGRAAHRGTRGADHLSARHRPRRLDARRAERGSPTTASSASRARSGTCHAARGSSRRRTARARWSSSSDRPARDHRGRRQRSSVEDGKLVAADGGLGPAFIELLRAHGETGTNLAELGVGTNERARLTGNVLEDEKILGTVHVAFGASAGIGGTVSVPVHLDCVVVEADARRRRASRCSTTARSARADAPDDAARGPQRLRGARPGGDRRDRRRIRRRALLDVHSDPDHNRSVFTLAGEPGELGRRRCVNGARACRRADRHAPNTTASIPASARSTLPRSSTSTTTTAAPPAPRRSCSAIGSARSSGCPVFLYGELARRAHASRASRAAGSPTLARRIEPGELEPDFGPRRAPSERRRDAGRGAAAARRVQRRARSRRRRSTTRRRSPRRSARAAPTGSPAVRAIGLWLDGARRRPGLDQRRGPPRDVARATRRGDRAARRDRESGRAGRPRAPGGVRRIPRRLPVAIADCRRRARGRARERASATKLQSRWLRQSASAAPSTAGRRPARSRRGVARGRPPTRRREEAPTAAAGAREARLEHARRPGGPRSSAGAIAAALLFVFLIAASGEGRRRRVASLLVALLIYMPSGYYIRPFLYRRRHARRRRAPASGEWRQVDGRAHVHGRAGAGELLHRAPRRTRPSALIVDPGDEAPTAARRVDELGVTVEAILMTHRHFDHVGAVAPVAEATARRSTAGDREPGARGHHELRPMARVRPVRELRGRPHRRGRRDARAGRVRRSTCCSRPATAPATSRTRSRARARCSRATSCSRARSAGSTCRAATGRRCWARSRR